MSYDDDPSPEYRVSLTRSNTLNSTSSSSSIHWQSPFDNPPAPVKSVVFSPNPPPKYTDMVGSVSRRLPSIKPERYLYTYTLTSGGATLQFLISVEPSNGRPSPGKYTFRLTLRVDKVERSMEEAVSLYLAVDPRNLDFIVFTFPGKSSVPPDALHSYRVWLRVNGIDHRLFGDDELWIARDPDFTSIADASFARLKSATASMQIYDAMVGRAHIQFIVKLQAISETVYQYTFEYDANGVGGILMDNFRLILEGDPRKVSFLIYTVPMTSMPAGASHRIRIWLKTSCPHPGDRSATYSRPFNESHTFQRIYKSDGFKIGAQLDFGSLGPKMVMGYSSGPPKTIIMSQPSDGHQHQRFKSIDSVEIG